MSDNVKFSPLRKRKSVYVCAISNRRLGTRRYDIGFPNVLITVFLFPVAIPFLSPMEGVLPRKGVITEGSYRQPMVGVDPERG